MNTIQDLANADTTRLIKIDPEFFQLQKICSHAAVYRYDATSNSWKKIDIMGSLYLYERNEQPQFGLIVMSERNLNSFFQRFDSKAIFVMNQPFLLIRAVQNIQKDPRYGDAVHCVWFHEPRDCLASANILRKMGLKFEGEGNTFEKVGEQSRAPLSDNSPSSPGSHKGNHLHQILRTGTKEPMDERDLF